MHAVVATVTIAAGQAVAARATLEEQTIPRVKQAPGFVKGYWTLSADGALGTSMVVFATKQDAENAANMARSAMPPNVTMNTMEIKEVVAEA
jgi:hypothetical protein